MSGAPTRAFCPASSSHSCYEAERGREACSVHECRRSQRTVTESDKTGSAAAKKLAETIVRRANEGVQTGLGVAVNFNPTGLVTLIDMYLDEAREAGRQEMASYVNNFCARSPLCSRSFEP